MKVLIAEDNELNQRIFRAFLRRTPYEITIANNGLEALEIFKTDKFDCILMDLHMPVMDGIESSRNIRLYEEENKLNRIPIIAVTASHPTEDKEKCFEAGMSDFIQKPITEEVLIKVIEYWIKKTQT